MMAKTAALQLVAAVASWHCKFAWAGVGGSFGANRTAMLRGASQPSWDTCVAVGAMCDLEADAPYDLCCGVDQGRSTCVQGPESTVPMGVCMPTGGSSPLAHYEAYALANCYQGHGGVDLGDVVVTDSAEACARICDQDSACLGFVWMYSQSKCWQRAEIVLPSCELGVYGKESAEFSTFVKTQQPQCVQEGQTCDGPGLQQRVCCEGMRCERHLLGTDNLQCVRAPQVTSTMTTTLQQCVQRGEICGCAGCLTQQCCDGRQCLQVAGQGGERYCVNIADTLVTRSVPHVLGNATSPSP